MRPWIKSRASELGVQDVGVRSPGSRSWEFRASGTGGLSQPEEALDQVQDVGAGVQDIRAGVQDVGAGVQDVGLWRIRALSV